MCSHVFLRIAVCCLSISLCCQNLRAIAQKQKTSEKRTKTIALLEMPVDGKLLVYSKVSAVKEDGTMTLSYLGRLSKGDYLGLFRPPAEGGGIGTGTTGTSARLFRLKIDKLKEPIARGVYNVAIAKFGKATAAFLGKNDVLTLFRPKNATAEWVRKIPEMISLDYPEDYELRQQSKNNLTQLGIAIFNHHEMLNRFPPAAIYGPDGKPWHSWRVLILQFLGEEEQALFNRYKLDEPWNGPNNKKLLSKMPGIYRDPLYPKQEGFYTNYAAAVGEGTAFPPDAQSYTKNANGKLILAIHKQTQWRMITDGTSNTVMFGTIGPDKKIPWMKPEDIAVGKKVSKLGSKDSFSTPFSTSKGKATVFTFCDGAVRLVPEKTKTEVLKNLFNKDDGNVIRSTALQWAHNFQKVEIYRENGKVKGRFLN